jgi:hypothetical protein
MVDFTTQPPMTLDNGMVSVSFSATDGTYTLNDAIVVLQSQYDAMTPADIEAEEQRRWDDWIVIVNPPAEEDVIDG